VGEVLFPSLILGQIAEAINYNFIISPDDDAEARHTAFVRAVQLSFNYRHNAPNYDFQILHATRVASGLATTFRIWRLTYVRIPTKAATDSNLIAATVPT